ncbi:MAG: alpha/beta hydrolase, partial [Spirochaetota bacterium]
MSKKSEYLTHNNQELFYRTAGSGSTALVMIHGLAGDSRLFHNQIKYFSPMFRIIAPDLPGHGNSKNYLINVIDDYDNALNTILEKEKIKSSIILGHSMGGAVAINYYIKHKNRVKALILVSTSSNFNIHEEAVKAAEKDFYLFYESLIKNSFSKKAGIFLAAAKNGISELHKAGIIKGFKICSTVDLSEKVKEIEVPVLLIGNKQDNMLPIEHTV